MVAAFKGNDQVVFGDINLRDDRITKGPNGGDLGAGKGGWPTIRYFNSATGADGKHYDKLTKDAMCTELGPGKPYLQQYIETRAGTTLAEDREEL